MGPFTLRVASGAGAGTLIPVQREFVVGRAETGPGGLRGDSEISRRHARFYYGPTGRLVVEDLGSTNGTAVNGTAITSRRALRPGDRVTLGETVLEVLAPGAAGPPAPLEAPAATGPAVGQQGALLHQWRANGPMVQRGGP